jgi:hypothetical protein
MGLAVSKKDYYDSEYDAITMPVGETRPAPYGFTITYPKKGIALPRWRLGATAERLRAFSLSTRRLLACCLVLGILGSFCAALQLWSAFAKAGLEKARTEIRSLEGRMSELKSIALPLSGTEYGHPFGED